MEIKEFWKQYDQANKEHEKWEKRADKVVKRFWGFANFIRIMMNKPISINILNKMTLIFKNLQPFKYPCKRNMLDTKYTAVKIAVCDLQRLIC